MTETLIKENEQNVLGLPVNRNVMFSDHHNIYKPKIEKYQTKFLQKIPFIKTFLKEDETILLVTRGCSPMPFMEQFLTGWIVFYLKRSLFIFTNKRIFHIPTRINYSYRNSIARILYSDCQTIEMRGRTLVAKYKNGKKEKFYYMGKKEKKKIKELLKTITTEGSKSEKGGTAALRPQVSEAMPTTGRIHLCPRCTKELVENEYICPNCRLEFKNKDEARKISLIYPGGGYFYTGHPWLGTGDAITETILSIFVIVSLIMTFRGEEEGFQTFIFWLIILILEKAVTVYHSNHFINEYIPKTKEIHQNQGG